MLLLKNCKLIKELTEGTELEMADITIKNNKIDRIFPCGTEEEEEWEVYDVNGATVLPGLINGHVHLFEADAPGDGWGCDKITYRTLAMARFAEYLLRNGYTTVRDCGDDLQFPAVAVRERIKEGYLTGPTVICGGVIIIPESAGTEDGHMELYFANSPMEFRKAARVMFENYCDFIKLYGTGSMISKGNNPDASILMEDEIIEAVKVAKMFGSYAAVHCHGDQCIQYAIKNGIRTIEHASYISDESCKMLDGRTDVGLILTLSFAWPWLKGGKVAPEKEAVLNRIVGCLKNAYNYDILMGWGTDVSMAIQKDEVGMEFRLRKELLGFSNIDMLKQATINTAKLLMIDDKVGSVKEGKNADLIIVDGDPTEDITLMYQAPARVLKNGVFIS